MSKNGILEMEKAGQREIATAASLAAPPKLRGGDAEMTRLKEIWRGLDQAARDYWREQLDSRRTCKNIREEMNTRLSLNLRRDCQITRLRQWLAREDERDAEHDRALEEERRLNEEFGDASLNEIRATVFRRSYARTIAQGDFKLGLRTVSLDLKDKTAELSRKKSEFNEAKECLAILPELKFISTNSKLTDTQKIDQVRLKLFGKIAPNQPPPPAASGEQTTPPEQP